MGEVAAEGARVWTPVVTTDEKLEYVLEHVIPMLQNDMRVVAETGCRIHGGKAGPNFTLTLLCMVARETIGMLSAPAGSMRADANRRGKGWFASPLSPSSLEVFLRDGMKKRDSRGHDCATRGSVAPVKTRRLGSGPISHVLRRQSP